MAEALRKLLHEKNPSGTSFMYNLTEKELRELADALEDEWANKHTCPPCDDCVPYYDCCEDCG